MMFQVRSVRTFRAHGTTVQLPCGYPYLPPNTTVSSDRLNRDITHDTRAPSTRRQVTRKLSRGLRCESLKQRVTNEIHAARQEAIAMNYPNPFATTIPPDSSYSFTAMANAAYFQRAIISLSGQQAAVFNGRGEGIPMQTAGGSEAYQGSTRGGTIQVSLLFQFSPDGVNYSNAMVAQVLSTPTTLMIGTEDSTDGDNNDTVLTLSIAPL